MTTAVALDLDWRRAHRELTRLARDKSAYDADEARWIRIGFESQVHLQLGFASFLEYLERTFGYGRQHGRERLRVARALGRLPRLTEALADGRLSWSAVRELTRIAVAETEEAWLGEAEGLSVREIERAVAGRLPGDHPEDPVRDEHVTKRLVLDVTPETYATFREAVGALRVETDTALSDEAALLEMSRRVLGGPRDDGAARLHDRTDPVPHLQDDEPARPRRDRRRRPGRGRAGRVRREHVRRRDRG